MNDIGYFAPLGLVNGSILMDPGLLADSLLKPGAALLSGPPHPTVESNTVAENTTNILRAISFTVINPKVR